MGGREGRKEGRRGRGREGRKEGGREEGRSEKKNSTRSNRRMGSNDGETKEIKLNAKRNTTNLVW